MFSLSLVSGEGSILVTPFMSLLSVLHIPNFVAKLLSIACITRELNYSHLLFRLLFLLGPSDEEDNWQR
jgi:hypothetical protein